MTALPLAKLLPIYAVDITLRFVTTTRFQPFHQPALTGLLHGLLGAPADYDRLLTVDAPECGRIHYRQGDRYRFSLFALAGGETLLQRALDRLGELPHSSPVSDDASPFRDNLVLAGLHDFFRGYPVSDVTDLGPYDQATWLDEIDQWQDRPAVRLRWLSPARLLRDKAERADAKGEQRFCRNTTHLTSSLLNDRIFDSLADLLRRRGETTPHRPPMLSAPLLASDLFWVDCRYRDAALREQVMGGLMGLLDLPLPADQQWPLLVLGQYCGIGQRRSFGWGRYRLETGDGRCTYRRCTRAVSLLERAVEPGNLATAYDVIEDNVGARSPGEDQADPLEDDESGSIDRAEQLNRNAQRLAAGRYAPPPLKGVLLHEKDGGLRPLAIPPFIDRVLQRAVAQTLGAAIEPLLAYGSFGYRPRRSRLSVRQMIAEAYRNGYRWVYESDIDDFFDSVTWARLRLRLEAVFGDDPVVDQALDWMAAPVSYEGQIITRSAGLPQGSPLSPLLANLMLDDFDSDLESAGFKLARFADDFVVLCRDRDEAESAARAAEAALAEVGLRLNRSKTRVRSFEQGFRFLGYWFLNSLSVDATGDDKRPDNREEPQLPPGSWLAQLARRQAGELSDFTPGRQVQSQHSGASLESEPTPLGERIMGTTIFVTGKPARLSTSGGRLQLRHGEDRVSDIAWHGLSAIVLIGPHQITTPALRKAMRLRVAVHFASSSGRYQGCTWPGEPGKDGWQLWRLQQDRFADTAATLELARTVVIARLRHQREVLRQRDTGGHCDTAIADIDRALHAASGADSASALNGAEGSGARAYFAAFQHLTPTEFGFSGRNRHPPRDPFNALLSLGYTILYAHAETVVRSAGLLPWVGFYHGTHGRHAALASDLMEPFRHLVERTALSVATGRRLRPDEFWIDPQYGCRLLSDARRRYLQILTERFDTPVRALGETLATNLHGHLHHQVLMLIAWLRGHSSTFHAWRQR